MRPAVGWAWWFICPPTEDQALSVVWRDLGRVVCGSLMGTNGFPVCSVPLAGSRPGGRHRTRPLLRCSAVQKGLSTDTEPLLKRLVGATHKTGAYCRLSIAHFLPFAFATITHGRAATLGDSGKPLPSRRAAEQQAGKSSDQAQLEQTTGSAGSPFLVTSLATQRSNPPAGAGPGQFKAK